MRIYISGPITGLPELNRPAFREYAEKLAREGKAYFNPQSIVAPSEPLSGKALWQYYMRECVKEIPKCTEMHMLRGYENSSGATWEKDIAEMLGMKIVFTF